MQSGFNNTWVASISLEEFLQHCERHKGKYGMSEIDAEGYYNRVNPDHKHIVHDTEPNEGEVAIDDKSGDGLSERDIDGE